jgi:hypothetical protein
MGTGEGYWIWAGLCSGQRDTPPGKPVASVDSMKARQFTKARMDENPYQSPRKFGESRRKANRPVGPPRWDMPVLAGFFVVPFVIGLLIVTILSLLGNR